MGMMGMAGTTGMGGAFFACKAVLFDCDGVLVDSGASVMSAWARWARDLGLDAEKVCSLAHGRRSADTVALLLEDDRREEALARVDRYEMEDANRVTAIAGAVPLLASMLPGQWALVTSGRAELARARLRAAGLPTPLVMVSADDVTAGKPDPEGYLMAAERLGFSPAETVVIEDAVAGIEAARGAGVGAVVGVGASAAGASAAGASAAGASADRTVPDLSSLRWAHQGLWVLPYGVP